jgi:RNA polymerase sigma-70 factor (ECF subfamily)
MSDPAEHLCRQAQAGDRAAASELVGHFYERMFAFLRRQCGNDEDAADLTQKTFAKAWASLDSYQGRSSFSTWLHGVAHHVCADWRRQRNPAESQSDEWWAACAAPTPSPFDDTAERDAAHRLYTLVEQLDDEARLTVHLHYYQGLTLAETAEVFGVAASTVKYRLRGALELLRSRMADPKRPVH